jgi:hypothetical protein
VFQSSDVKDGSSRDLNQAQAQALLSLGACVTIQVAHPWDWLCLKGNFNNKRYFSRSFANNN